MPKNIRSDNTWTSLLKIEKILTAFEKSYCNEYWEITTDKLFYTQKINLNILGDAIIKTKLFVVILNWEIYSVQNKTLYNVELKVNNISLHKVFSTIIII